jgi:hypothetical protein
MGTGVFIFEDSTFFDPMESGNDGNLLLFIHPEFGQTSISDAGELLYTPWDFNQAFEDEFFAIVDQGDEVFRVWAGSYHPIDNSFSFTPVSTFYGDHQGGVVDSYGYSMGPVKAFFKWLIKKLTKQKPKTRRTDTNRVDEWFHREQDRRRRNGQDAIDSDVAGGVIIGGAGEIVKDSIPIYGDLREVPDLVDECEGLAGELQDMCESIRRTEEMEEEQREREQPEIDRRRREWLEYLERMKDLDPNGGLG